MKDIEIAHSIEMKDVRSVAFQLGIAEDDMEMYGKYKAKLPLSMMSENPKGRLILVTAMTPTPAGEGKTTVSIGLSEAMNRIGKKTTVVLREPSLGPVFGIKGGAAGGGYSQVVPMEDINLHFTGDLNAVEKAHNLLAALVDNNLQSKTRNLGLDARTIRLKRVIDMNERALRSIIVGLGGEKQGVPRESGFNITAASEVMAILCLSTSVEDLKNRLANIYIGDTWEGKAIYARDLNAQGAMAALLKDAIKPNLVQTLEGNPAIIHGGPFANIAQGTNSIIATKTGLSISDYVVTEAGFGSDLGAEKFFDIKCQYGGLWPSATVIVATIRALKYHGGVKLSELSNENVEAVKTGLPNLTKHIENITYFGIRPIVAINRFSTDTDAEVESVKEYVESLGFKASITEVWAKGGQGALELAALVTEQSHACERCFTPLYQPESTIKEKIDAIAHNIYGAKDVHLSLQALKDIKKIQDLGLSHLPICIAKTQKSLSDDPNKKNRPEGFVVKIKEIEIASGAGFLIPIAGSIMRMPGLGDKPAAESIDIDNDGNISGIF